MNAFTIKISQNACGFSLLFFCILVDFCLWFWFFGVLVCLGFFLSTTLQIVRFLSHPSHTGTKSCNTALLGFFFVIQKTINKYQPD